MKARNPLFWSFWGFPMVSERRSEAEMPERQEEVGNREDEGKRERREKLKALGRSKGEKGEASAWALGRQGHRKRRGEKLGFSFLFPCPVFPYPFRGPWRWRLKGIPGGPSRSGWSCVFLQNLKTNPVPIPWVIGTGFSYNFPTTGYGNSTSQRLSLKINGRCIHIHRG